MLWHFLLLLHVITCFILSASQEQNILSRFNASFGNLASSDTKQSDLWLISRDDPVPAQLNRNWSPDVGLPGVQQVATFHRRNYGSRISNSPISDAIEDRVENPNAEVLIVSRGSSDPSYNGPSTEEIRRQSIDNNALHFQTPEAVLLELPAGLTSGLWERPQPQLMNMISSSGKNVNSPTRQDVINLDNVTDEGLVPVSPSDSYFPVREATNRLPSPYLEAEREDVSPALASYGVPSENIDTNNSSVYFEIPSSIRQNVWIPVQGRTSSSSNIGDNGGELLYEIAYDEFPARHASESNIGLTLTKDDIEVLEKLGILSTLTLETTSPARDAESLPTAVKDEREQESYAHFIDNGGQSYRLISEGRFDTNLSDAVLIDVPEFTSSNYHGNIPETSEHRDNMRPEPYISMDSLETVNSEYNKNVSSSAIRDYNATSLTPMQVEEIFQLLGLHYPDTFNYTSLIEPNSKKELTEKKTVISTSNVTSTSEFASPIENRAIETSSTSSPLISATVSTVQILENQWDTPSARSDEPKKIRSPGLVSLGRIQPRLLEKLATYGTENEIPDRNARRIVPFPVQKLNALEKLNQDPKPYVFGYKQNDENGTLQHRNETSDVSGVVQGTYGYRDPFGLYRYVNYIADNNGFHAVVRTNEPGTVSHNSADAVFLSELPPREAIAQMMEYAKARQKATLNP